MKRRFTAVIVSAAMGLVVALVVPAGSAFADDPGDPTQTFFGQVTAGQTSVQFETVTNTDAYTVAIVPTGTVDSPFDDANQPHTDTGIGEVRPESCYHYDFNSESQVVPVADPLAPGSACRLYFSFSPVGAGNFTGEAYFDLTDITDDVSLGTAQEDLFGDGVEPAGTPTAKAPAVDFGNVTEYGSEVTAVAVTNTSSQWNEVVGPLALPTGPFTTDVPAPIGEFNPQPCSNGSDLVILGPGASCYILVAFEPTGIAAATVAATIPVWETLETVGTDEPQPQSAPDVTLSTALKGTGVAVTATAAPSSAAFGSITFGTTRSTSVTVSNTSTSNIKLGAPVFATAGPYSLPGGFSPCANQILSAPNTFPNTSGYPTSCTFSVQFAPTKAGAVNSSFTVPLYAVTPDLVADTTSNSAVTIKLSGTGTAPTIALDSTTLSFGLTTLTSTVQKTVTVTDTSFRKLVIPPPTFASGSPFSVVRGSSSCIAGSTSLAVLAFRRACTYVVAFAPTGTSATSQSIKINAFAVDQNSGSTAPRPPTVKADASATLSLKGQGSPATASIAPAAFGNVTVDGEHTQDVVVTNTSTLNVFLDDPVLPSGTAFAVNADSAANSCGYLGSHLVIAPAGACVVQLRFDPKKTGAQSTTLKIGVHPTPAPAGQSLSTSSDTPASTASGAVTGAGVTITVAFSPTSLQFGDTAVGSTAGSIVTVTNTSDVRIVVSPGALAASSKFTVETSPSSSCINTFGEVLTLAPGDTCQFSVVFRPTAKGAQTASDKVSVWYCRAEEGSRVPAPTSPAAVTPIYSITGTGVVAGP